MPVFIDNDWSVESYWRSIILFGKNSATYKFALAKSLLDLSSNNNDLILMEELAQPFSKHICEHLKIIDKQGTNKESKFLDTCRKYNNEEISYDNLINTTKKLAFTNVIDRFHEVNNNTIQKKFYIDERSNKKGIRLTDEFYKLNEPKESLNFIEEVEARWRLVETAWSLKLSPHLLQIKHDDNINEFFIDHSNERISVTSSRKALNGYQKGKCFFCFDQISIVSKTSNIAHVDHFFPHVLKGNQNFDGYVDGVWNLVLSCQHCNNGSNGKFALLPKPTLLERLYNRNEYFCSSHNPLKQTIENQIGIEKQTRKSKMQDLYNQAKEILVHTWEPEAQKGDPLF